MTETKTTPEMQQTKPGGVSEAALKRRKKLKRRRIRRTIITLVIIAAVIGGTVYGLMRLFREEEPELVVQTAIAARGSIQSVVTGGGQAMPRESSAITLSSGGKVLEVFVKDGDIVQEGDPLYIIDSTSAVEAVDDAQKSVNSLQKQLDSIVNSYADLTVYAEHGGMLINHMKINIGDDISQNTKIGTIVDDSRMRLELYFSYAYENDIKVGQEARVSIPSLMSEVYGEVKEINYVRRVTSEGSRLFGVVIEIENPGSLADGMGASAMLISDGLEVYPYEGGALSYARTTDIITKAGGTAEFSDLLEYAVIKKGQMLLKMDAENNDEMVATLENQLRTARETLERAQTNLDNFNAFAPMSGTVLSCSLTAGETVDSGRVAITIANTASMVIDARIDEMNIAYVKQGTSCTVTQYSRDDTQVFMGIIESISLEAKFENNMAFFPSVISVDNLDGRLMSGMYVEYSLVASQSDDCILVPVQAVKYTSEGVCVFLKADAAPDGALDAELLGIEIPEGFYAVPVTIGISDTYNVEIIDGIAEFSEIYTQTSSAEAGMGGGMGGGMVRIG